mmetsp:Transcript_11086/g.26344  ORF Transcript_11086/g.26344 Transcript_11086/m.26344 type:complete len:427 (+) Transcript_11086:70-1350(+)
MPSAHNRSGRVMLLLAACLPSSAMIHFGAPRHPQPTLRRHDRLLSSRAFPVMQGEQGFSSSAFTECPVGADECPLPESEFYEEDRGEAELMEKVIDYVLLLTPIVLPVLAGLGFEDTINTFHNVLERLADLKWVQVDGGLSRTAALLPVMTGIVLPCVSFALGTLTATTISTLRARQVGLRTTLNEEACLVRNVLSATEAMFPAEHCQDERRRAALLLRQYCTRVLVESRSGIDLEELQWQGASNSELDGITRLFHHAPPLPEGVQERGAGGVVPRFHDTTHFLAQMYVEKLQLSRSQRLAMLTTTFPQVHWIALTLLGLSVIFGFLLAADQQTLLFLAPVQLRLLFAVLVGALSATACICTDLNDPFRGAFQITPSSQQLYLIREVIDRTLFYGEFVPQPPAPVLSSYKKKRVQQRVRASVRASE